MRPAETWSPPPTAPTRALARGESLALDDAQTCWIGLAGALELVAAPEGQPEQRIFLAEINPADIALVPPGAGFDFALVARTDATVALLPWDQLARDAPVERTAAWADRLIEKLLAAALDAGPVHHPESRTLRAGASELVAAGESLVARSGVVWVEAADVDYLGAEAGPDAPGLWPLTKQVAVAARGALRVEGLSAAELARGQRLLPALQAFYPWLLDFLVAARQSRRDDERARQQRRREKGGEELDHALRNFVAVVEEGEKVKIVKPESKPLVAACELIAGVIGGKVVEPPPPVGAKDWQPTVRDIAQASGLRVREVALRGRWWQEDLGPILAFRGDDPVALLPEGRRAYRLYDPLAVDDPVAVTARRAEALALRGFAFYPSFADKPQTLRDVATFGLSRCKPDLFAIAVLGLAGMLVGLLTPVASGFIFNRVVPNFAYGLLGQVALGLGAAYAVLFFTRFVSDVATLRIDGRVAGLLQAGLLDRVLRLPGRFLQRYATADLVLRLMGVEDIRRTLTGSFLTAVTAGSMYAGSAALLFYYAWPAAALAVGMTLLFFAVSALIGYRSLKAFYEGEQMTANIISMVYQMVAAIRVLRVGAAEERAFVRWGNNFTAMRVRLIASDRMANYFKVFTGGYQIVALTAVFAAIALAQDAALGVGAFIAFVTAFSTALQSAQSLGHTIVEIFKAAPIIKRTTPLLQAAPEPAATRTRPGALSGEIEVNNVHFRYGPDAPMVLQGCSLRIEPGEWVALVGRSGSGKSTLVRLLLGLDRPLSGAVYYDRQDLSRMDLATVRRQLGVVLQNAQVFPGTVFENIAAPTGATLEEAWAAAEKAGLAEVIAALPMEMHTVLTEGGASLSGGELQRLVIARAFAADPRVLVLDEATNALDNATQQRVIAALEEMPVTRLTVAHRLSTVRKCDRILVLDQGRIAEAGTYEELRAAGGAFAGLARHQLL